MGGVTLEEAAEQGFIVMTAEGGQQPGPFQPDEPYNPFVAQTEDKKPYETLTGRVSPSTATPPPRSRRLGAVVPTARHHARGRRGVRIILCRSIRRTHQLGHPFQLAVQQVHASPAARRAQHLHQPEAGRSEGHRGRRPKVRIFNSAGEFFAHGQVLSQHARRLDHDGTRLGAASIRADAKPMNNTMATLIQPLELAGRLGGIWASSSSSGTQTSWRMKVERRRGAGVSRAARGRD